MSDENEITVYWFSNDGMAGPCEDSIEGILEDVRTELENWNKADPPIILKITTGKMTRSKYDELPEFEGY